MPISTRTLRTSFAKGEEILTRTGKAFRIEAIGDNRIVFRPRRGKKALSAAWDRVRIVVEHFDEIKNSRNLEHAVGSVLGRFGQGDSQNEPYLYGLAEKFWMQRSKSNGASGKSRSGYDYLVLWKYPEALRVQGSVMTDAVGKHAEGLKNGDRMFVIATTEDELYLLGAIEVKRSGRRWAAGKNLSGAFRRIPLRRLKWQLRFEGTPSTRLVKTSPLAMQVRARRRLWPSSASLLLNVLATDLRELKKAEEDFRVSEGRLKQLTLSTRERSRAVRIRALALKGTACEICGFDFAKTYGDFARNCVEVHHIEGLSRAGRRGVNTSLDDVLVLCPNCHRALHQFENRNDWKAFRRACRLG